MNVSGGVFQLSTAVGSTAGSASGSLNVAGAGAVNTNADITNGGGTGSTATVTVSGATALLNMTGHNLGSAATPLNSVTLGTGTLQDLGTCFGNVALNGGTPTINQVRSSGEIKGVISGVGFTLGKSGSNSLLLSGANTYSGSTTISGGTLAISNTQSSPMAINAGTTLLASRDNFHYHPHQPRQF